MHTSQLAHPRSFKHARVVRCADPLLAPSLRTSSRVVNNSSTVVEDTRESLHLCLSSLQLAASAPTLSESRARFLQANALLRSDVTASRVVTLLNSSTRLPSSSTTTLPPSSTVKTTPRLRSSTSSLNTTRMPWLLCRAVEEVEQVTCRLSLPRYVPCVRAGETRRSVLRRFVRHPLRSRASRTRSSSYTTTSTKCRTFTLDDSQRLTTLSSTSRRPTSPN